MLFLAMERKRVGELVDNISMLTFRSWQLLIDIKRHDENRP